MTRLEITALLCLASLLSIGGCTGLPPAEMRERPILASWTAAAEPQVTARCIARDIDTELRGYGARAVVHPGATSGIYDVFQFEHQDWIIQSFEALRAIFTVEPEAGASKISYRHSFYTSRSAARVPRFGTKN